MKFFSKKKLFLFLFLLLITNKFVFALVINQVELAGATKTKKRSLMKWGGIELGKEISAGEYDGIVENLRRAYQFNLKEISLVGDTLKVSIEDKWSLFPVPMISQSGNYYSRGLLIYENNFLGRLGTIVPGIFWTNSGMNGLLYWQEDNIITQNVGMKVILLHKSDLTQFERKDEVIKTFETRVDTIIMTPNYHRGRNDFKLGPIYLKKKVFEQYTDPVFKSERFGIYFRHHYNLYSKLPVLFDGLKTTYDMFYIPKNGDSDFLQAADMQYVKPFSFGYLLTQIHFSHTNNGSYLSPKMLGGNNGHRGYDRESIAARMNYGAMVQTQFHLWKNFYTSPFYEFNKIRLITPVLDGAELRESTVGLNVSYYFEKISIPAVIIEYARNIDDESNHINLNVGLKL